MLSLFPELKDMPINTRACRMEDYASGGNNEIFIMKEEDSNIIVGSKIAHIREGGRCELKMDYINKKIKEAKLIGEKIGLTIEPVLISQINMENM